MPYNHARRGVPDPGWSATTVWPVNDTTVSPSRAATPRADVAAPIEVVVLAVGAVVVGLVLRFVTRSPLWLDEALSVNIAHLPLGDIPEALRHDGHPPLYYFILHGWMALFGTGDVAVRALSGLFSVAALPLAWTIGRRRGGSLLAWLTVGVLALAPFALRYATETRMYSMVILLVLVGYLLLDDVTRRGRDGLLRLAGLALVSGALLLTHYWSFWLVGAVEVVLAWQWWRDRTPDIRRSMARAFVAIAAGGLLFLPWVPAFLYQSAHTGTPWASPQQPFSIFAIVLADFGGGGFRASDFVGAVLLVLVLLALFGVARGRRHIDLDLATVRQFRFEAVVLVLTLAIGIGISTLAGSAFASRYAAVFFPLFVLLVAGGITRFGDRRLLAGAFALVLALSCMGAYWNVSFQRSQGRVAARAINASASPGDVVVMCPDQLGPAYSRSLRDDLDAVTYPAMAAPDLVDWVDYGERNRGQRSGCVRPGRPHPGRQPHDLPHLADQLQDLRRQVRGRVQRPRRGPARVDDPGEGRWLEVLRAGGGHGVPGSAGEPVTGPVGSSTAPTDQPASVWTDVVAVLPAWATARVLVATGYVLATVVANRLLDAHPEQLDNGLLAWDGTWYRDLATSGYHGAPLEGVRFFPLFPLLGRLFAVPLAGHTGVALVLLANVFSLVALVLLRRLVLLEKHDDVLADRAVWCLAVFPSAFVLVMAYSESLMLVAAIGAFIGLKLRRWWWVAALGLVAALSRPVGVLLVVPVAVELVRAWRSGAARDRSRLGRRARGPGRRAGVVPGVGRSRLR